jgi:hypothetical protein
LLTCDDQHVGVNESRARLHALRDQALPALPTILGSDAPEMLRAALEPLGGQLASARISQISWWPGRSLTAVFKVRVAWASSRPLVEDHVVVSTGAAFQPGAICLEDEGEARVSFWRLTQDPSLPGLALALDPIRARGLLDGLLVRPGEVTTQLRAYRPGHRAVVELRTRDQRVFVKVVPPARIATLQAIHKQIATSLPVPRSHGWSDEYGLVVLEALPGISLRAGLLDKRVRLPGPEQIAQLLDQLPAPTDKRRAPSQTDSGLAVAPLLRELVPECAGLINDLVDAVRDGTHRGQLVPVHGDLHEAQLTVQDGRLAGLLDLDTTGLGHRVDDWAAFLGHLAVLTASVDGAARERVRLYAGRVMALADQQTQDPVGLRQRIAGVILGLASGPFRVQSPTWLEETRRRLCLAEPWLKNAEALRADESFLRPA